LKKRSTKVVNIKTSVFELEVGNVKPGASLASLGVNMGDLCRQINSFAVDKQCVGKIMRVKIMVNPRDRSFKFEFKAAPTVVLLKEKAGIEKGSSGKKIVGTVTEKDIEEIAKSQLTVFNTSDIIKAKKIVSGTAKSIGLEIVEQ
jgi:large subunit ribosomal protein L11